MAWFFLGLLLGVFFICLLAFSDEFNEIERRQKSFLRKLVGRKTYNSFFKSENQIKHSYEYLLNTFPEFMPIFERFESDERLKFNMKRDDVENLAEMILKRQKL